MTTATALRSILATLTRDIQLEYATRILARHQEFLANSGTGAFLNFSAIHDLSAISYPIRVTLFNLHPVKTTGLNFAAHFAYVPLWIMAGASMGVILVSAIPLIKAGVRPIHVAAYRVFHAAGLLLLVSFFLSIIVLAFGGTFVKGTHSAPPQQ